MSPKCPLSHALWALAHSCRQAYVQHQSPGSDVITDSLLFTTGELEGEEPDVSRPLPPYQSAAMSFGSAGLLVSSLVGHLVSLVQDGVVGKGRQVAQEGHCSWAQP